MRSESCGERVAGAARVPVPRQRDVDGLLDEHALVALGAPGRRGARRTPPGPPGAAAFTRLPASARVRAGQRPDLAAGEQQRATRSPRCAGLAAASASRSAAFGEGLPAPRRRAVGRSAATCLGRTSLVPDTGASSCFDGPVRRCSHRRCDRTAPVRPHARVEAYRGGRGEVEALGPAVDRHPHAVVGGLRQRSPVRRAPRRRTSTRWARRAPVRPPGRAGRARRARRRRAWRARPRGRPPSAAAVSRSRAMGEVEQRSRWTPARPCRCAGRPCRPRARRRRPPPRRPPARPCPRCRDRRPRRTRRRARRTREGPRERHVEQVADGEDALRRDGVGEARRGALGDPTRAPAPSSSGCRAAAASVTNSSRTRPCRCASRTAWAPSTRNRPARSRPARRSSLRAATTRAERSVRGGSTCVVRLPILLGRCLLGATPSRGGSPWPPRRARRTRPRR